MEEILFIAHHFPPVGGPAVTRSLHFVSELPAFNYKPIVITVAESDLANSDYPLDPTLANRLPDGIEIFRVATGEPVRFRKMMIKLRLFRLFWFFLYPLFWERSARWPRRVVPVASSIASKKKIKLVYTTSGPFSSALVGYRLKKKYAMKWVADLRDPFTDAYAWQFPGKLHWFFCRWMEKRIFSKADVVIMNTEEARKLFVKRGINKPENIIVITNGF